MAKVTGRFDGLKIMNGTSKKTGKPYKMYKIVVNGTEYGIGFDPVKASNGDTVSFNAEENDRGYMEADPKSFRVVAEGSGDAGSPQATRSSGSDDPTRDSIEAQVALKAAVEVVVAQIAAGVPLSSPSAAVSVLTTDFKHIIRGTHGQKKPAPKPAPKRVEPEDENQDPPFDDDSLPY